MHSRSTLIPVIVFTMVSAPLGADIGRPSGPNLVKNGDFEAGLRKWSAAGGVFAHRAQGGRGDTACLEVHNRNPKAYRLCSQTVAVRPGKSYQVSGWIRTESVKPGKGGGGATLCMEWGAGKRWIGGVWDKGFVGTTTWQELTLVATIPKSADRAWVHLYLTKGAIGRAWFDDVEAYELVPRSLSPVVLQPGYRGIIWPDEREQPILIRVNVDDAWFPEPGEGSLRLEALLNGRLASSVPVPKPGSHVLRLDGSALAPGLWKAEVRLTAADGKEPLSAAQVLGEVWAEGRPRPRVWVDRHRRAIVNGKPFFPIGLYLGGVGRKELDPLAGSDFNTVMPYAILEPAKHAEDPVAKLRAVLDDLHRRGLMVVVNLLDAFKGTKGFLKQGLGGIQGEDAMLRAVIEACRDHPAVLAYYTNDEYPVNLVPYFEGRYRFIRELDPNHPTWVCLNRVDQLSYYANSTDVMGVDPYPIGPGLLGKPGRLKMVAEWTRVARGVTEGHGPVWIVPQVFNYGLYHDAATLQRSRAPTQQEIRCMTFLALAEGASGLIHYSMFDLLRDPAGFDERWRDVCAVTREVKLLEPALLTDDPPPELTATGPGVSGVRWRALSPDRTTAYIIVANAEQSPQQITLKLPKPASAVETIVGASEHPAGRTLEVQLPVHGAEVYCVRWQGRP